MAHLSSAGVARLHEAMATRVAVREMPGLVTLLASGDDVAVDPIGTQSFDGGEPTASTSPPLGGAGYAQCS